jgi:hypothetical protein
MSTEQLSADEFETLQASGREVAGNQELATVTSVTVGPDTARLELSFDWKRETDTASFDLDCEREVLQLKSLARGHGYAYDQLPYLEGEELAAVYLDGGWVPAATLPDVDANVLTETATEPSGPGPVARVHDGLQRRAEEVTSRDVVLAVVVLKKILIAGALVYLLLTV